MSPAQLSRAWAQMHSVAREAVETELAQKRLDQARQQERPDERS